MHPFKPAQAMYEKKTYKYKFFYRQNTLFTFFLVVLLFIT